MKKILIIVVLVLCFTGCRLRLSEKAKSDLGELGIVQTTKKNGFVDIASRFIDSTVTFVNSGRINIFSTDTMYFIPVGDNNDSCVSFEFSTSSPFNDTWSYAYVGVSYDGIGYDYYFIGEDESHHGLGLISRENLLSIGKNKIYSEYSSDESKDVSNKLKTIYNDSNNITYTNVNNDSNLSWIKNNLISNNDSKNTVVFFSKSAGCSF